MPTEDISVTLNKAFSELTKGLNEMNAQMFEMSVRDLKMLNEMAPHNVLGKMGQGAGTFSAKMTTQQLRQKNIFGEG